MQRLLDRLLVTLEVRLEAFALLEIASRHRLAFDALEAVIIHYVLSGTGWLEVPGKKSVRLSAGTIAVLPANLSQAIRTEGEPDISIDAAEHCAMVKDGVVRFDATSGSPVKLRVLCGSMMPTTSGSFGLFDGLKEPLLERFEQMPIVEHAFTLLRQEIATPGLGTRAVVGSLMKLPLVLMIRRHVQLLAEASPLLAGASDERLSRAVSAVMDAPADAHTVASLASFAGMSRSAFARAFTVAFNQSPMEFVAKARLHHAAELLRGTALPVKVIAASIGFASRSHFSRAFRKAYGRDPQRFRKDGAAAIGAPNRLRGDRKDFALDEERDDDVEQ